MSMNYLHINENITDIYGPHIHKKGRGTVWSCVWAVAYEVLCTLTQVGLLKDNFSSEHSF